MRRKVSELRRRLLDQTNLMVAAELLLYQEKQGAKNPERIAHFQNELSLARGEVIALRFALGMGD